MGSSRGPRGGSGTPSGLRAHEGGGGHEPGPARKLKPGPGLKADAVFADQRSRLRMATIEMVAQAGVDGVTVRGLSQRAGVSTRTFYRQFANVPDCVGFAVESTLHDALRRMRDAGESSRNQEEAVHATVTALLQFLAGNQAAASVALLEVFDAGAPIVGRLQTTTRTFEDVLADLLREPTASVPIPRRLLSGLMAGLLRTVRATFLAGKADELPTVAPTLSRWLLALAVSAQVSQSSRFNRGQSVVGPRREAEPLPDGRGYQAGPTVGDDRQRIVRAAIRLAAADGFASLTVPRIRRVAGVSRRSFDAQFDSVPQCFLASLQWLAGVAATRARTWAASETNRERHIRRLLGALAAQVARNSVLANLVLIGVLEPGRSGLVCRESMVAVAAAAMRGELEPDTNRAEIALGASVAAIWEMAAAEVAAGRASRLPGQSQDLTDTLLIPLRALQAASQER